jgi:hypothetical protein
MTEKEFKERCLTTVKEIAKELEELAANPQSKDKTDSGKQQNLREYFEDALDVIYSVDRYGDYRRVAVTITTGGPHIEVDTNDRAVKLWWGGEKARWSISRDTAEAIDDIFHEYYQAIR